MFSKEVQRYRIISIKILADALSEKDALETLQMFQSNNPDKIYEIEVYNYNPLANRMGRDPDLH